MNFFIEGSQVLKNGNLARKRAEQVSRENSFILISVNKVTSISINMEYNIKHNIVRMSVVRSNNSNLWFHFNPTNPPVLHIFGFLPKKNPSETFHAFEKILRIRKTNNSKPPTFNGK